MLTPVKANLVNAISWYNSTLLSSPFKTSFVSGALITVTGDYVS